MMEGWHGCKNILCMRLDNMGDLVMSSPAITALKETFQCRITVLTSSTATGIARFLPSIDKIITFDSPWVKQAKHKKYDVMDMVSTLRAEQFDAVVIFTVFSQNPLAAALLAYLADIPKRLAYCRENPYHLLTNWVPDEEPYTFIRHQVRRDLDLVGTVGATANNEQLTIHLPALDADYISLKLSSNGIDMDHRWLMLHPGVSERKREYPEADWIETGKQLRELGYQVLITGTLQEKKVTERIAEGIGVNAFSIAGILTLAEFIHLIKMAPLVISVNTSTIHLAAAVQTPVIVLYALTNPQHTPWRGVGKVLPFSVHPSDHSRNEVLKFVSANYSADSFERVTPSEIIAAARAILIGPADLIPDDVLVAQTNKTLNLSAP